MADNESGKVELKSGDVVRVKSGGPWMAVGSIGDYHGTLSAWCTWFEKGKADTDVFDIKVLVAKR